MQNFPHVSHAPAGMHRSGGGRLRSGSSYGRAMRAASDANVSLAENRARRSSPADDFARLRIAQRLVSVAREIVEHAHEHVAVCYVAAHERDLLLMLRMIVVAGEYEEPAVALSVGLP